MLRKMLAPNMMRPFWAALVFWQSVVVWRDRARNLRGAYRGATTFKVKVMTAGNTAKTLLPNSKWRQILAAVAIALSVWLLDFFGALPALDDMGYDACLRVTSAASTSPAHVLLVYVDREQMAGGSDVPEALARTLLNLGARKVGFTCTLPSPTSGLVNLAQESGNILLSRAFRVSEIDPDRLEFSSSSNMAGQLPMGLVGLSPRSTGVYRSHFGRLMVDESWQPSLESIIARDVLQDHKYIPEDDFRIAFRGGPGSLPHIDYESVVAGNLVRELVNGKVVLIGLKPDSDFPGISTPTTRDKVKMSLLEFHGHVLQSLLIAGPIRVVHPIGRFILLLLAALVCHVCFRAIRFKWGFRLVLAVMVFEAAIALILLGWQSLWIPFAPLALVQIFCFAEINLR